MTINDRAISIVKYSTKENWLKQIPKANWLCILFDHDSTKEHLDEVIAGLINNDVCYICTVGHACEKNHDLADEEIVLREVEVEEQYLPNHLIITTWHAELEEGIWFAIFAADHDEVQINKIIILDMTNGNEIGQINKLLIKFKVSS